MAKYKKQSGFLETVFLAIGSGLWFLISYPFKLLFGKRKTLFNKQENFKKWLEIEKLLNSGDIIHAEQAVMRGDKFFENILKIAGVNGNTFADKLRSYEKKFSSNIYQYVWDAHKLRNKIAHNAEYKPTIEECKNALNKFRQGLENIGAL